MSKAYAMANAKKKKETVQQKQSPSVSKKTKQVNDRLTQKYGGGTTKKSTPKTVSKAKSQAVQSRLQRKYGGTTKTETETPKRMTLQERQNQKSYGDRNAQPVKRQTTSSAQRRTNANNNLNLKQNRIRQSQAEAKERREFKPTASQRTTIEDRLNNKYGINKADEKRVESANRVIRNTGSAAKKGVQDALSGYGQTIADLTERTASNKNGTQALAMKRGIDTNDKTAMRKLQEERDRTVEHAREERTRLFDEQEKRQQKFDKQTKGAKGLEKALYGAVESGTGMAVDMVAGLGTQGGALASMGLRTYGSAANQARKEGATDKEAGLYGLAQAGKEVGTELMFPGVGLARKAYGSAAKASLGELATNTLLRNLKGKTADVASAGIKLLGGTAEENLEEIAGWGIDPILKEYTYGRNVRKRDAENVMRERSDALRSQITNEDDAKAAAAYISSPSFIEDTKREYINSGMNEKDAEEIASRMRDYLSASLTGDTKAMSDIEDEVGRKVAGLKKLSIADWDFKELAETVASTTLLTATTGMPGTISTATKGAAIRDALGSEGTKALAKTAIDFEDEKLSRQGRAIQERLDSGKDITSTQAYELMSGMHEQVRKDTQRVEASRSTAARQMESERLVVPFAEDPRTGNVVRAELTEQTFRREETSAKKAIEDQKASLTAKEVDTGSRAIANFKTGIFGVDDANALNYSNTAVREAFKAETGINLDSYIVRNRDGSVDIPATNTATKDALFALAADNLIKTAQAETVNWMDNVKGEVVTQITARMGAKGSVALQQALDDVDERDRSRYMMTANATDMLYQAARNMGESWEEVKTDAVKMFPNISEDKLQMMYEAGLEDRNIANDKARGRQVQMGASMSQIGEQETATGMVYVDTPNTPKGTMVRTFTEIAQNLNADIHLTDAIRDKDGSVIDRANGSYDPKTNSFYLNVDTGIEKNVGYIFMHELTHYLRRYAPEQYQELENLVREKWFGYDASQMQDAIAKKIEAYKIATNGKQILTEDMALEEIICDAAHEFINDPNFAKSVAEEDPTLAQAVLNSIRNALRMLRRIFASGTIEDETHMNSLFSELGILSEAEEIWLNAYKQAVKNRAMENLDAWEDEAFKETRLSIRTTNDVLAERDARFSITPEQQEAIVKDISPDIRFSIPTFRDEKAKGKFIASLNSGKGGFAGLSEIASGKTILRRVMEANNFLPAQVNAATGFLEHMADYLESDNIRMKYEFIGWDDISNAEVTVRRDADGNIVSVAMSAMVVNGEYPVNFDMTTICNKREGVMEVIQALTQKYDADTGKTILNSVKLTDEKMWSINKALKAEGIDTACLGCFVEARRYYTNRFIDKIDDVWNAQVREARRKLGLPEEEYFNFAKGKKVSGEDYNQISDLWTAYDESSESKRSPSQRIKILMDEIVKNKEVDSPYLKLISAEDILTPEGIRGFKELSTHNKDRDMVKMIKSIYGTSAPKEILAFTPYNSEIALLPDKIKGVPTNEYLKSIGGTRVQSFSDFKMEHFFDHLQMVADEAARGFVNHGYSKVIAYPRLFGLTGRKINMSVMFDVLPASTWKSVLNCSDEKSVEIARKYQGLRFVKEKPAENKDNRPYKEITLEGVHGYLTYLVSDADYVNSEFDKLYQENLANGMSEEEAKRKANTDKPFEQSINYSDAVELENKEGYKKNVGIIGVAFGDEHLKMLLDDPNVRYIIPYHRSGLPVFIAQKTALDIARDYTDNQNTNKAKGGYWINSEGSKERMKTKYEKYLAEHSDLKYPAIEFFANEINGKDYTVEFGKKNTKEKGAMAGTADFDVYENLETAKDIREISNAYLEYCIQHNFVPVFHEFAGHPNYYKMLFDFAVTDGTTDHIYPQQPVKNIYPGLNLDEIVASGRTIDDLTDDDFKDFYAEIERGMSEQNAKTELRRTRLGKVLDEDLLSQTGENSIIADTNIQHITNGTPDYTSVRYGNEEVTPEVTDADVRHSISVNFDDAYMSAVNSGNMEEAQRLVDEAAKSAGYGTRAYHGTPRGGFTRFEVQPGVHGKLFGDGFYFTTSESAAKGFSGSTARERATNSMVYNVYLNVPDDALEFDWNNYIYGKKRVKNPLHFIQWDIEDNPDKDVIIHNVRDGSKEDATVYVIKSANNIKSSDPVTYADDGSVIPLSERFDPTNNDIRYSLPTQDADGNILSDGQMEYFKNSQARDSQGKLVPVYHTTKHGGFTIFDPSKSDDHRSLFFSDSYEVSQTYGDEYTTTRFYSESFADVEANEAAIDKMKEDVQAIVRRIKITGIGSKEIDGETSGTGFDIYVEAEAKDENGEWHSIKEKRTINVDPDLIDEAESIEDLDVAMEELKGDAMSVVADMLGVDIEYLWDVDEVGSGWGLDMDYTPEDGIDAVDTDGARADLQDYGYDADAYKGYYAVYLNLENPLVIDGRGNNWNNISNSYEGIVDRKWEMFTDDDGKQKLAYSDNGGEETIISLHDASGHKQAEEMLGWSLLDKLETRWFESDYGSITTKWDTFNNKLGSSSKTRDIAEYAYANGYDGVIIRNISDVNKRTANPFSDIFIAFSSNQVKDTRNLNPTENPDIRYSIPSDTEVKDYISATAENIDDIPLADNLLEENRVRFSVDHEDFIREAISKFSEGSLTFGLYLDEKSVKKNLIGLMGRVMSESGIKRKYRSDTLQATINSAKVMFFEMKANQIDDAAEAAWRAAAKIVDDIDYNDELYVQYKGVRDYLSKRKIQIPEGLGYDPDFVDFVRDNNGRMRFSEKGPSVNAVYKYLSKNYPQLFPTDITDPIDMLLQIDYALDYTTPYREAYTSEEYTDLVNAVAGELMDIVAEGKAYQTVADKLTNQYENRIQAMKVRHEEAIRKVKETEKEKRDATRKVWSSIAQNWKQKYQDRIQKDIQERKEKSERKEHRKRFERVYDKYDTLCKWVLDPTKEKNVPEELRKPLAEFLQTLDLQTENSKALEAKTGHEAQKTLKLRELKDRLKALSESSTDDDGVYAPGTFEVDGSIPFLIGKMADKLDKNGNSIDALDNNDIATIDEFMKLLIRNIERYKEVRTETKMAELRDIGGRIAEFFRNKIKRDGEFGKRQGIPGAIGTINTTSLTPAYLFDRMGPLKEMYDVLRYNGFDTYIRNEKMIMDRLTEILGSYYKTNRKGQHTTGSEIEEWRDDRSAQTIHLESGKDITMSVAQIMSLYCLNKRGEQATDHMMKGGILVEPLQAGSKIESLKEKTGLKKKPESSERYVLTTTDIINIITKLTPEQMKVANQLQELMSVDMAKLGNEAHRELYGYNMFKEDNYFPIKVEGTELPTDVNTIGDVVEKIKSFGFTKPLTPKAGKAIVVGDIFSIVADHCNGMNLYNAYLVPITDFMKVLNYTHTFEDGEVLSTKKAIEQAYGKEMLKYIMNLMKDINGIKSDNRGGLESLINNALGKAKKASVAFNIRVAVQQPTAIVRAATEINPKYIKGVKLKSLTGLVPLVETEAMEEMKKYCPIAQWKDWGYYDTYMGRDIEDVMMNKISIADTIFTSYYGRLDNVTWSIIWQAVKAEQADAHPDMDTKSEEFLQLCGRRASEIFDKTQVVDSTFHRSDAMRNKDIVVKGFTAFMAEPTLTLNVLRGALFNANEAAKEGRNGEARKIRARAVAVLMSQAVLVSAAQAVADAWRGKDPGLPGGGDGDDDEKTGYLERWLHNFVYNMIDQVHLEDNIYLIKDIKPYLNYVMSKVAEHNDWNDILRALMQWDQDYMFSQSNIVFSNLENTTTGISQALKKLEKDAEGKEYINPKTKEEIRWYDINQKVTSGFSTLTGIPVSTMLRDFKPIWDKVFQSAFAADSMMADPKTEKLEGGSDGEKRGIFGGIFNKDKTQNESSEEADTDLEDLPEGLTEEQIAEIRKAEKRRNKNKPEGENGEAVDETNRDEQTMLFDATKAAVGYEGEERNKKIWASVSKGYKDHIDKGDLNYIYRMKRVVKELGGDTAYLDEQVFKYAKTAMKKTIISDPTDLQIDQQKRIKDYLLSNGMSEAELSQIAYESDTKNDLKVAFRINDEDAIVDELVTLLRAGISRDDIYRIYDNRNKIDLAKYKDNGGKYADRLKSTGNFVWPTQGTITSHFGYRNSPTAGASSNHPAIDIGAATGTPVVAADGGVVITAGSNGGYGNSVGIKHDNGMVTYYNHLYSWNVKVGDTVAQGQQIAQVGSTGISTGPHLDFKILDQNGKAVDPEKYLPTN